MLQLSVQEGHARMRSLQSQLGPDGVEDLKYQLLKPYRTRNVALGLGLLGCVAVICKSASLRV